MSRAVDVIGFHEFGHLLMRQYFFGTTRATREFSVRWFEEFMATYLGHGYLWHSERLAADPVRAELELCGAHAENRSENLTVTYQAR